VTIAKKAKNVALVAGTQQNLSNLDFILISVSYADCCIFTAMQSVVMVSVSLLSVVRLSVIILSVVTYCTKILKAQCRGAIN
jgi:hypothetical protein